MELRQLEYFRAIVDEGSISGAVIRPRQSAYREIQSDKYAEVVFSYAALSAAFPQLVSNWFPLLLYHKECGL